MRSQFHDVPEAPAPGERWEVHWSDQSSKNILIRVHADGRTRTCHPLGGLILGRAAARTRENALAFASVHVEVPKEATPSIYVREVVNGLKAIFLTGRDPTGSVDSHVAQYGSSDPVARRARHGKAERDYLGTAMPLVPPILEDERAAQWRLQVQVWEGSFRRRYRVGLVQAKRGPNAGLANQEALRAALVQFDLTVCPDELHYPSSDQKSGLRFGVVATSAVPNGRHRCRACILQRPTA